MSVCRADVHGVEAWLPWRPVDSCGVAGVLLRLVSCVSQPAFGCACEGLQDNATASRLLITSQASPSLASGTLYYSRGSEQVTMFHES